MQGHLKAPVAINPRKLSCGVGERLCRLNVAMSGLISVEAYGKQMSVTRMAMRTALLPLSVITSPVSDGVKQARASRYARYRNSSAANLALDAPRATLNTVTSSVCPV
jgi:hypothetical protein